MRGILSVLGQETADTRSQPCLPLLYLVSEQHILPGRNAREDNDCSAFVARDSHEFFCLLCDSFSCRYVRREEKRGYSTNEGKSPVGVDPWHGRENRLYWTIFSDESSACPFEGNGNNRF